MRTARILAAAAFVMAAALVATAAVGHPLSPSLLQIEESATGRAKVLWKTPVLRVPGSDLRPVLPSHCTPVGDPTIRQEGTGVVEQWEVDCRGRGLVGSRLEVADLAESKTDVLLRVVLADGRALRQVLTAERPAFDVPERQSPGAVVRDYARLGVQHILTGFDHLLFVFGLVLLVGGGRPLLWTVTAFTLGHSVTLTLAVLGFVHVPPGPVEALIAATILVLAVELTRPAEPETLIQRWPWGMAFGFGLLHGLGFAGALAEVGLPAEEIPLALFSFNLGIEFGQLVFVVGVLAVGAAFAPLTARLPAGARRVPAYVIGCLSAFWLIERVTAVL